METIITLQSALSASWSWISDNVAGIIASMAMIATAYQAYVARVHNKASVRPHLCTTSGTYDEAEGVRVNAFLHNAGLGPAFIESFEILVGDVQHPVSNPEDILALVSRHIDAKVLRWECHILRVGSILRANEDMEVANILFSRPRTYDDENKFEEQVAALQLRICYRSLYGERVVYDSRVHKPLPPST